MFGWLIKRYMNYKGFQSFDVLLTHHDNDCAYEVNGKHYSQHMQAVKKCLDAQGYSCLFFNGPFVKRKDDDFLHNTISFKKTLYISFAFSYLFRRLRMKEFSDVIGSFFWKFFLEQYRPKFIIGIQPYSFLCMAARDKGIPIYDYQHGIISPSHWWYGDKLKEVEVSKRPSGYLLWNVNALKTIESWECDNAKLLVVGNLWINQYKFGSEDLLDNNYLKFLREEKSNNKKNILVSLQWGLGEIYYNTKEHWIMPQSLAEIIHEFDGYNWLIRLHPIQLEERDNKTINKLSELFRGCKNVYWDYCSLATLPSVLNNVDLHITDSSTVAMEAEYFGVPTAMMNPMFIDDKKFSDNYMESVLRKMVFYTGHDKIKLIEFLSVSDSQENKGLFSSFGLNGTDLE